MLIEEFCALPSRRRKSGAAPPHAFHGRRRRGTLKVVARPRSLRCIRLLLWDSQWRLNFRGADDFEEPRAVEAGLVKQSAGVGADGAVSQQCGDEDTCGGPEKPLQHHALTRSRGRRGCRGVGPSRDPANGIIATAWLAKRSSERAGCNMQSVDLPLDGGVAFGTGSAGVRACGFQIIDRAGLRKHDRRQPGCQARHRLPDAREK